MAARILYKVLLKKGRISPSASSTPEFMFEFTPHELKLHKVYFAEKFSKVKLARLGKTGLQSTQSSVSTPIQRKR